MRPLDMRQAAALSQEIERVKSLDPDGLGLQWRNAFGKSAPKELPKALLIKILLYRLQADALGDLAPRIARVLEGYAAREASKRGDNAINPSRRATPATMTIKPGSVLVREMGRADSGV